MVNEQPLILLTNDDGIHAKGLRILRAFAQTLGEVIVAAPNTEQSAVGHSITLYDPIKAHEVYDDGIFYGYAIGGTPADSVKLAIHYLLPRKPNRMISGINNEPILESTFCIPGQFPPLRKRLYWERPQ